MSDSAPEMYIELLKRAIMGELAPRTPLVAVEPRSVPQRLFIEANRRLGVTVAREDTSDPSALREGRLHPPNADSMIGRARMDNVHDAVRSVVRDGVAGDLIETGVWRGGTSILMKGILEAYGDRTRKVWVADSFRGVPPPNPEKYPADRDCRWDQMDVLRVTKEQVRANFDRYGLLDQRVVFLEGWFKDTLPPLMGTWSVIRLDGDLYESTMDAISVLYPCLSPGGFVLIDDYESIVSTRSAIDDYRAAHDITEPILTVDWSGAYWRRET